MQDQLFRVFGSQQGVVKGIDTRRPGKLAPPVSVEHGHHRQERLAFTEQDDLFEQRITHDRRFHVVGRHFLAVRQHEDLLVPSEQTRVGLEPEDPVLEVLAASAEVRRFELPTSIKDVRPARCCHDAGSPGPAVCHHGNVHKH